MTPAIARSDHCARAARPARNHHSCDNLRATIKMWPNIHPLRRRQPSVSLQSVGCPGYPRRPDFKPRGGVLEWDARLFGLARMPDSHELFCFDDHLGGADEESRTLVQRCWYE